MSIVELLQRSELFSGLSVEQIEEIAVLTQKAGYSAGDIIIRQGDATNDLYIVQQGMVEVLISKGRIPDVPGPPQLASVVRLGRGQVFGEMALVDRGARSATVRCVEDDTVLHIIPRQDFLSLCEDDRQIGYQVMRNIASDLSFKLRHRNLRLKQEGAGGES